MGPGATAGRLPAAGAVQPGQRPAAPRRQGSFLDEWLHKRRRAQPSITTAPNHRPLSGPPAYQQAPAPPPLSPAAQTPPEASQQGLEEGEVHKIAAELKQQLDTPEKPKAVAPTAPKKPAKPGPPKPKPKTEDTISLENGQDDTIVIDRDGTFHSKADKA